MGQPHRTAPGPPAPVPSYAMPRAGAAPGRDGTRLPPDGPLGTGPAVHRIGPAARPPAGRAPGEEATGSSGTPALKILVAGGFGAGKTTLVGAVSEIRPLCAGKRLAGAGRDAGAARRTDHGTTPAATMDFGRITIRAGLSLHLFGTPGQDRSWFLWGGLSRGALGAVVLADTRRLQDCSPAADHLEYRGTPVVPCDARDGDSGKGVLVRLVEHAGRVHTARLPGSAS